MTIDIRTQDLRKKQMIHNGNGRKIAGEKTTLTHEVEARLPTDHGPFIMHLYEDESKKQHLALVMGDISSGEDVLTRVHSECLTGDLFGSLRCDCQSQLHQSIDMISEEGQGVIIYLRQEGRGIGLSSKLHSYNLQDEGYDTVDANTALGFEPDSREYEAAALILRDLGVRSIRLLTNNPDKSKAFTSMGISVRSMINISPRVTEENRRYLRTKTLRLNQAIDLETASSSSPEIDRMLRFLKRQAERKEEGVPFLTVLYAQSINGRLTDVDEAARNEDDMQLEYFLRRLKAVHPDHSVELPLRSGSISKIDQGPGNEVDPAQYGARSSHLSIADDVDDKGVLGNKEPSRQISGGFAKKIGKGPMVLIEAKPEELTSILGEGKADLIVGLVRPCLMASHEAKGDLLSEMPSIWFEDVHFITVGQWLVYYGVPSNVVNAKGCVDRH